MRLLIVTQYFWPENFRVNDLVSALKARGHEITVLTGLPNYPDGKVFGQYQDHPAAFSHFEGVTVHRVPILPRASGAVRLALNYLSFVVSAAVLGPWRLRDTHFDVIFVYQPSPITTCLPALWLGRLRRTPVVLWTLDLWPETLQAIGAVTSPRLLDAVGNMVTFIYRRCALVLGQSQAFAPSVAARAGTATPFRYLPQWAEPMAAASSHASVTTSTDDSIAHAALAPHTATFNVMFAGNIGHAQDFPSILDAAEQLKDRSGIRWLVVGDGRAAEWVRAEVARRALGKCVFLLGRYPLVSMPVFYAGASALLVTLRSDPVFSLTIPGRVQSYLASGRPLLGMLDGEGARVITESGAGWTCAAGNSSALAANVARMAALPAGDRETLGCRGKEYAAREFDRDGIITRLEGWLGDVVNGHAPAVA